MLAVNGGLMYLWMDQKLKRHSKNVYYVYSQQPNENEIERKNLFHSRAAPERNAIITYQTLWVIASA